MSQHDFDIAKTDANTGVAFRSQVNSALQALASNSSGSTEPSTPYAYQLWADSTSGYMKMRNTANSAWISLYRLSDGLLPVTNGGTGTTTFAANCLLKGNGTNAVTASGVYEDASGNVQVNGGVAATGSLSAGAINNTPIGNTTPAAGAFTNLSATMLAISGGFNQPTANLSGNCNGNLTVSNHGLTILTNAEAGTLDTYLIAGSIPVSYMRFGLYNGTTLTECARFTSAGNLLVGAIALRTYETHIIQTSTDNKHALTVSSAGNSPVGLQIAYPNAAPNTGSGSQFLQCVDSVALRAIIYSNGTFGSATSVYGGVSDVKLKTNIEDARSYLSDLCQVKIKKYNFIHDPDSPKQLGVIAQELEQVFPGMVDETPDYEEAITIDEDGNEITERVATGTVTRYVKYSIFIPMLITAVQELSAINTSLEQRLAALEAKLA